MCELDDGDYAYDNWKDKQLDERLDKTELSPCPFCGGKVELSYIGNDHTKKRSVEVDHIRMGCPVKFRQSAIRYSHEWLAEKVAEAWNQRVKEGDDGN